jgi:hypothetical protein
MHPKTREAYVRANFDFSVDVAENVEQEFKRRTQGRKIDRRIDQIYRKKRGSRDFIIYNVTEIGTDLSGNKYTNAKIEGRYKLPQFRKGYDPETGHSWPL